MVAGAVGLAGAGMRLAHTEGKLVTDENLHSSSATSLGEGCAGKIPAGQETFKETCLPLPCMLAQLLQSCPTLGLQPAKLLYPWNSPGKNTGVGCCALLLGIFLTQGSNPHLLCLLH